MTSRKTKKRPEGSDLTATVQEYLLVLHNDDIHSFDYVIDALIDICNHDYEQAVQCTMITHHNGKCDVKKGSFDSMKQMKDALTDIGLSATVESTL